MNKQIQKIGISYLILILIITMSFGNTGYAEETIAEPVVAEETIAEPVVAEETIAEPVVEDIVEKYNLDFMSLGYATLITGKTEANSVIFVTSDSGIFCEAKTSSSGKFSCMFVGENLTRDSLKITD